MAGLKTCTVLLFILYCFFQRGIPSGISTHVEIAHRALEFFISEGNVNYRQLLLNHQDAFQAGSTYPDAFYPSICKNGVFHDVSEDTHWSPFLSTSIQYIRRKYPQPWEEATEKLVAFLFGIASHMVADVSWHSLGIDQGFLKAMGEVDFRGSYSEAHNVGDFGGDVLSQFELDFSYLASSWYVPVKDLAAIYKEFYKREIITESTITDCTYLLFLELHGERLAVAKLFPAYAGKSPFLVEKFHEYFLGGVDDMAFWTNNIFELTSHMLEEGTSGCLLPENPLFINCTREHKESYISRQSEHEHQKNATSLLTKTLEKNLTYTERGVHFIQSWATNSLHLISQAFAAKVWGALAPTHQESSKHISKPVASYFLTSPYARLGWAMISADLNQDGYEDLVVGAPGYSTLGHVQIGRVYVVYGTQSGLPPEDMDLDGKADQVLQGHQPSGRFGSALAVLDFNEDGVPDLAIGAPSVGSQFLTYKGAVYVYFGTAGRGLASQPNVTITCQYSYCNLGWSLLAADVDGDGNADLVVGSPYAPGGGQQRGFVVAFYSYFNRSDQGLLSVQDANWIVKGEENYAWFGFSLASCQLENITLLLIGSPTWKSCAGSGCKLTSSDVSQSVGKVYGYNPPSTEHWFAVAGDKAMGRMGLSLASGIMSVAGIKRTVLAVGAPTTDSISRISLISSVLHQAGLALVYDLTDSTKPSLLSTFSGDRRFSRFGGNVYLNDLDDDGLDEMIVTSPLRSNDISVLFGGAAGRVYIYNGNQTSSGNVTGHCKSRSSPCPEDWAQYVLISPEELSRFGSSVITLKSGRKKEIVVAAERSSVKARLGGRLFVYSL